MKDFRGAEIKVGSVVFFIARGEDEHQALYESEVEAVGADFAVVSTGRGPFMIRHESRVGVVR